MPIHCPDGASSPWTNSRGLWRASTTISYPHCLLSVLTHFHMLQDLLLLILVSKSVRFLSTFLLKAVGELQGNKGTQRHWLQLGFLTRLPSFLSGGTWHVLCSYSIYCTVQYSTSYTVGQSFLFSILRLPTVCCVQNLPYIAATDNQSDE